MFVSRRIAAAPDNLCVAHPWWRPAFISLGKRSSIAMGFQPGSHAMCQLSISHAGPALVALWWLVLQMLGDKGVPPPLTPGVNNQAYGEHAAVRDCGVVRPLNWGVSPAKPRMAACSRSGWHLLGIYSF